jgi:hypothetical protein
MIIFSYEEKVSHIIDSMRVHESNIGSKVSKHLEALLEDCQKRQRISERASGIVEAPATNFNEERNDLARDFRFLIIHSRQHQLARISSSSVSDD